MWDISFFGQHEPYSNLINYHHFLTFSLNYHSLQLTPSTMPLLIKKKRKRKGKEKDPQLTFWTSLFWSFRHFRIDPILT